MADAVTQLLARRLREARHSAGLTLQEVANECGVAGKATVSRWENESSPRRPEDSTLIRLANLYGVSLDFLFGQPHADPESPALRAVRAEIRRQLSLESLRSLPVPERVRRVLAIAREVAPEAIPEIRLAKLFKRAYEGFAAGANDVALPADGLTELASLLHLPLRVFLEG